MKLLSAFVGLALVADQSEAKSKTPFRRRLQKTFDLLPVWRDANLADHPHSTELRSDKSHPETGKSQTKFDFKFNRLTEKIYDIYEDRIIEIAQGCPDINTCTEYQDCTGVGDRMNTVRGRPAVELSDAYLDFVKDKWGRSKAKVFSDACGFSSRMLTNVHEKVESMIEALRNWRLQCRRFPAESCPAHCEKIEKSSGDKCGPK